MNLQDDRWGQQPKFPILDKRFGIKKEIKQTGAAVEKLWSLFIPNFCLLLTIPIFRKGDGTLKYTVYIAMSLYFLRFMINFQLKFKILYTVQKMKFFIKGFISKCDQIRRKLRIWSYLLRNPQRETSFCVQWKKCEAWA